MTQDLPTLLKSLRTCSIDGCNHTVRARGWCGKHYQRWQRLGDPADIDPAERIRSRIEANSIPEPNSGCWLWLSALTGRDHRARIEIEGVCRLAARVAYSAYRGEIPPGMLVLHRCDVPLCVNPDHLWLGTHRDNNEDCASKGRNPATKVTIDQAREIRALKGVEKQRITAARLGVSASTISNIQNRTGWTWLDERRDATCRI